MLIKDKITITLPQLMEVNRSKKKYFNIIHLFQNKENILDHYDASSH